MTELQKVMIQSAMENGKTSGWTILRVFSELKIKGVERTGGRSNMIFVRSFALGTIQSFYLQWQNHSIRKSKCNRGKRILKLLVKERNLGITLWGVLKSHVSWPNPRPALSTRNPEMSWNLNVDVEFSMFYFSKG